MGSSYRYYSLDAITRITKRLEMDNQQPLFMGGFLFPTIKEEVLNEI